MDQDNQLILQKLKELDDLIENSECNEDCKHCPFYRYVEEVEDCCCFLGDIVNDITAIGVD